MTSEEQLIKTAYEEEQLSPEQISDCQDLDIAAVKACLMRNSSVYRKDCGKEPEDENRLNFTDDELERANRVIVEIALASEDDHLRLKAATYIRDDKKGRKDINKSLGGMTNNIFMINEQMKKVRGTATNIISQAIGSSTSRKEIEV